MPKGPQQNAIGVEFVLTVKENGSAINLSSGVDTKEIVFIKANGDELTKTAGFKTDGSDGKVTYVTISGDLDPPGNWSAQAKIKFTSGFNGRSDKANFPVEPN